MSGSLIFGAVAHCFRTLFLVACDLVRLAFLATHSHSGLAAENLFLRKQLALFQERKIKPRRADDATRWMMASLSRMFLWRDALVNVKADTLIRWHRRGFRLFWRWKSKPIGRPSLPQDLCQLIRQMGAQNPTWGQERIANEFSYGQKKNQVTCRTFVRAISVACAQLPRNTRLPGARVHTRPSCTGYLDQRSNQRLVDKLLRCSLK